MVAQVHSHRDDDDDDDDVQDDDHDDKENRWTHKCMSPREQVQITLNNDDAIKKRGQLQCKFY